MALDLTPFGFTPTESAAYAALLDRGPLGGYALAKALSIARANAYQALDGLVAKRIASPTGERPRRYRPLQPAALLAMLAERESALLDRLEQQLGQSAEAGQAGTVPITSRRSLDELALRTAARSSGELRCLGPGPILEALAPAWHKREADGHPTVLWIVGDAGGTRLRLAGRVDPNVIERLFGGTAFLMSAERGAITVRLHGQSLAGYWSNDPAVAGAVRAALEALPKT